MRRSFNQYLINYPLGTLVDDRKVAIGTTPIDLTVFKHNNALHVFATSDHPTIIYSSRGKLLFANVNLTDVRTLTMFVVCVLT